MDKLDAYVLFQIAKGIGSDHKSLLNFILTQRHLVNFLGTYKSAVEELKTQVLIKVQMNDVWADKGNRLVIYHTLPNKENHGEYKEWHFNGQLFQQFFYKNGKKEGESKSWRDNGQLDTHCYYENDMLNGEFKTWFENGALCEIFHYENGEKHGECKTLFENGQLYQHLFYKKGKKRRKIQRMVGWRPTSRTLLLQE